MSIFNSNLTREEIFSLLKDVKASIRFIGILGSGMYPLASLLKVRGYAVAGSDARCDAAYTDRFGIPISRPDGAGWGRVDLAVYSLAIDASDPEIAYAKSHGIPLISRAQLLGAIMLGYRSRISVSGSHGKSTTTALIEHILSVAGLSPIAVSGASLSSGATYKDGIGDVFVTEACEYKDSFLSLCPTHQIITSVELDHTDYFTDLSHIRSSFISAARLAECVILNRDDPIALSIAEELLSEGGRRVITYGRSVVADYRLHSVRVAGDITYLSISCPDREITLTTSLIGEFNLYNITAAVAVSDMLGAQQEAIALAVASFRPIDRRLTLLGRVGERSIYYDYAHHPTEISAVIDALKERYGSLTVIFRPHTYSRTKSLWCDFIAALSKADFTIILDIYPAREKPIVGVDSARLASEIPGARYSDAHSAADLAISYGSGAVALLGAGEVDRVKADLISYVKKQG